MSGRVMGRRHRTNEFAGIGKGRLHLAFRIVAIAAELGVYA
jgi:hypothetical protein